MSTIGDKKTATRYWFSAKRSGWGWGPPCAWQGWVVMAIFAALVIAGAVVILPRAGNAAFVAYAMVLVVALVGVCWRKGEPPRWRRGER